MFLFLTMTSAKINWMQNQLSFLILKGYGDVAFHYFLSSNHFFELKNIIKMEMPNIAVFGMAT